MVAALSTVLCRGPLEAQPRIKRPVADPAPQNWILSTAPQTQAAAPLVGNDFQAKARRQIRGDEPFGSLLQTTLSGAAPAAAPFAPALTEAVRVRRARADEILVANALLFSPPNIGLSTATADDGNARRRARSDELPPNLLTSTLSAATPAPAPFVPADYGSTPRRLARQVEQYGSSPLLLSAWIAPPADLGQPDRAPRRALEDPPNLLLGTFSIAAQAVLPFSSGEWPIRPAKRFAQADGWPNTTLTTLQLAPTLVLPFASGEWLKAPPRRLATLTEAPNLAISTLALTAAPPAPFAPVDYSQSARRRLFQDDAPPNLLVSLLTARPLVATDFTQAARRRLAQAETTVNALTGPLTLPPMVVLPFPSGEWLHAKVKRYPQADLSPNITLTTLSLAFYSIVGKRSTSAETHRISGSGSAVSTIRGEGSD